MAILINFAHPITPAQLEQVNLALGQPIERVIDVVTHLDSEFPLVPQVRALVDSLALDATQWQTLALVFNLPSLNYIAATLVAELHGRMGYFPSIIRLRPVPDAIPSPFLPYPMCPTQLSTLMQATGGQSLEPLRLTERRKKTLTLQ